jgi:hypothetical protein
MHTPLRAAAATLLALALLPAHAERPLVTEHADILASRECEWESLAAITREEGADDTRSYSTLVGCGLGQRAQVALALASDRAGSDNNKSLTVLGKIGLVARSDKNPGITLAWSFAGGKAHNESFTLQGSALALVLSHGWAKYWLGHANLGWARDHSGHLNRSTWNLALERALGDGVDVMGELYGDDRDRPWLGLGVRWAAKESLSLNASYAAQYSGLRARLVTVGFNLVF